MDLPSSLRAGSVSAVQRLVRTPDRRSTSTRMGATDQTPMNKTWSSSEAVVAKITSVGHHCIGTVFQNRPTTAARKKTTATPARNSSTPRPDGPETPPTKPKMGLESTAKGQSNPQFPAAAGAKALRLNRAPSKSRMKIPSASSGVLFTSASQLQSL